MVAQDFARVYRANAVLTASPGQLVVLLFDGALQAMAAAREALARPPQDFKRYEVVHRQITKAQRIIAELRGSLNFEAGGEFAPLMEQLYEYYNRQLFEANLRKDPAPIVEVEKLLGELRDAWAEMLRKLGGERPADPTGGRS